MSLSYPRPHGYPALHATVLSHEGVWVAVQIRPQSMDKAAENGAAAHWKYKKTFSQRMPLLGLAERLSQIRTVLEQESQDADALLEKMAAIL